MVQRNIMIFVVVKHLQLQQLLRVHNVLCKLHRDYLYIYHFPPKSASVCRIDVQFIARVLINIVLNIQVSACFLISVGFFFYMYKPVLDLEFCFTTF